MTTRQGAALNFSAKELHALAIVMDVCEHYIEHSRISVAQHRSDDADGRQCRAVFLDQNTSQPICRLYVFDEDEPDQIALFDKSPITLGKTPEEDRQDIASVDDIHNFAERIRCMDDAYERAERQSLARRLFNSIKPRGGVKPYLSKAWTGTSVTSFWVADRLIDLMLVLQARGRRLAPTERRPWPKGLKQRLMRHQRSKCAYCGHRFSAHYFEIDHMDPATYGGSNDESNLQVLCGPCNRRKGDQTDQEFRRRYASLVPQRRLTPPARPVSQSKFAEVTRGSQASEGLQRRRRSRYFSAQERISLGCMASGAITVVLTLWGLIELGLTGNWALFPALALGLIVGFGLLLRARVSGALYS